MNDDDGYRLWLRYEPVADAGRAREYRDAVTHLVADADSPSIAAAQRELVRGLTGLLSRDLPVHPHAVGGGALVLGTPRTSASIAALGLDAEIASLGAEGYLLRSTAIGGRPSIVIAAREDLGVLYGAFALLRTMQTGSALRALDVRSVPRFRIRMLDHWDNLDGTVERGYAGFSLWDWHKLPGYVSPRYQDYARANASIGINGAALTNVNADALVLTRPYLEKVAALAGVLRPYGVRVFLTARFSAPIEIGRLPTADPQDRAVAQFWRDKAAEIYRHVPDFGGFVVKANSEGQPGPQEYGRTHAEGANVLADALAPHGGVVVWRAFVYAASADEDRAKQAYEELVPLDGAFRKNVLVQVKNGPIDFQPREPFHPLFGAMKATPLLGEFQITQEYLGFATHLAYLGTLFEETLTSDTHVKGPGSTVARALDGTLHGAELGGMAGVANIGNDRNWCGHPFAQANWYVFGRLAWDPALGAEAIAREWLQLTFTGDPRFVERALPLMLGSREAVVRYMTPLGLHHLMAWNHHYGPGPWIAEGRPDWTSVYFHRADADGIGFDRGPGGSDAVAQYAEPLRSLFSDRAACPENLLLWFHHVPWNAKMRSGRTLWDELCHEYEAGVAFVGSMRSTWEELAPFVDGARHRHVAALLEVQEAEARWWRDACVLYFQTFSRRPVPGDFRPAATLEEYIRVQHYYVPGIRNVPVLHGQR
jgi:alpha-glucuronidase